MSISPELVITDALLDAARLLADSPGNLDTLLPTLSFFAVTEGSDVRCFIAEEHLIPISILPSEPPNPADDEHSPFLLARPLIRSRDAFAGAIAQLERGLNPVEIDDFWPLASEIAHDLSTALHDRYS